MMMKLVSFLSLCARNSGDKGRSNKAYKRQRAAFGWNTVNAFMIVCVSLACTRRKVEVLCYTHLFAPERIHIQVDPLFGQGEIMIVQVDIQQVDEPRQLHIAQNVYLHNLPGYRKGGSLGQIVDILVARLQKLRILLFQQSFEKRS